MTSITSSRLTEEDQNNNNNSSSNNHQTNLSISTTPLMNIQDTQDQSGSERSTPLITPNQQRPSSTVPQPATTRALVAKCQACNIRGELIVCNHCENVICVKCADEHQSIINKDVKREWEICKTKYETINEQSSMNLFFSCFSCKNEFFLIVHFDNDEEKVQNKARNLQTTITKQSEHLIQTVENQKNTYIDIIENHLQTYKQS